MSPHLTAAIVPTSMIGTRRRSLYAVSGPSAGRAPMRSVLLAMRET